jgi:xanthine/uracil/vitamin C permease (AzgA family)
LAIGAVMLVLTATRALDWLVRVIPKSVVRGI